MSRCPNTSSLAERLTAASALDLGNVVRIVANRTVDKSLADSVSNVQGTIGVTFSAAAAGSQVRVITDGEGTVLMEPGLTLSAGDTIWVSETMPGRATNVEPAGDAVVVGIIKDTTNYLIDGTVVADIEIDSGGGGVTSLQADGNPPLDGAITLISGAGIILTESVPGRSITISAVGADTVVQVGFSDAEEYQVVGATETILSEWNADIDQMIDPTSVTNVFAILAKNVVGTAVVRLRVGGTIGVADGTIRGSLNVITGAFAKYKDFGAAFDMQTELVAGTVKITAQGSAAGDTVYVRGTSAVFSG